MSKKTRGETKDFVYFGFEGGRGRRNPGAELKITYRVHRHVNGGNFWKESCGVAFCATMEGRGCRLYVRGGERGRERERH